MKRKTMREIEYVIAAVVTLLRNDKYVNTKTNTKDVGTNG